LIEEGPNQPQPLFPLPQAEQAPPVLNSTPQESLKPMC
jgi:hypothetical protein